MLKRGDSWHKQVDFCSHSRGSSDFEPSPDLRGAFTQSRQPEMSLPPASRYNLRVDSLAIITDQEAEVISPILQHSLHRRSASVPKCIHECFSAYAINFISNKRPERARRALYDYLIFGLPGCRQVV